MILSTLRIMDGGNISNLIVCEDADFQSALAIVKVLLQHTAKVFEQLPVIETKATETQGKKTQLRQNFLSTLPSDFDRKTYLETAQKLNIPPKTAEKYIANLCTSGELIHVKHDKYCKSK